MTLYDYYSNTEEAWEEKKGVQGSRTKAERKVKGRGRIHVFPAFCPISTRTTFPLPTWRANRDNSCACTAVSYRISGMVGRPRSIKKESFSTKSIGWQRDSVFCNLSLINRISLRLVVMEVAVCGVLCEISMMQLLVMPIYKTLKGTLFIPQPIFSS